MKISSIELQLDLRILYLSIIHQYTNFRPNYRSEGGAMMDLKAVGQRIKAAREAKNPVSYTHLTLPTTERV